MLKTKKMPKQKQNKKQTQNDGKITKKKLIKPRIIGGKIIQQLSLKEKLDFLKECLKKYVYYINLNTDSEYFQYYSSDETNSLFNENFLKIFKPHDKDVIDFIDHLQYILLCLNDHDNNDSYTLLKLYYINQFNSDKNKLFDTIEIDEEKKAILQAEAFKYYKKYMELLNDFILKIISTADNVGTADTEPPTDAHTDTNAGANIGATEPVPEADPDDANIGATDGANNADRVAQLNDLQGGFGYPALYTKSKATMTPEESEKNFFETGMFKIYSNGIILLTIDNKAYNLKIFKGINKKDTEISDKEEIIKFLNGNRDSLIIRRYKNPENSNHFYDCQLQLMYKLVNILIENIGIYKIAIETQLQTNLKDKEFLLKYKTNLLDKLIAIIFEKLPDKVSLVKYGIILKSLKVIILNNKGIDDKHIDEKYSKYLTNRNRNIETTNIESIIALSNDKMPKYTFAAKCDSRREYFEHIINVLYTNKNDTEIYKDDDVNEDLEILIKLSASASQGFRILGKTLNEDNCRTTIEGYIKKYKSYLISEAYIGKLELLADYNNKYIQDSEYSSDSNSSKTLISKISSDELSTIEADAKKYRGKIYNYINNEPHLIARDSYLDVPVKMIAIFDEFIKDYEKIFKHHNLKLHKIRRSKVLETK